MKNEQVFADIYVRLNSEEVNDVKEKMTRELCQSWGVFSVHFDVDELFNTLVVAYNPEAVTADMLLEIIRKRYTGAVRVAGMLMRVNNEIHTVSH